MKSRGTILINGLSKIITKDSQGNATIFLKQEWRLTHRGVVRMAVEQLGSQVSKEMAETVQYKNSKVHSKLSQS